MPNSEDIVSGLETITKANAVDDYGLFYDSSRYRTTYFDNLNQNSETATEYIRVNVWNATFTFQNKSFFRVCRWREGHFLFAAPVPSIVDNRFLTTNVESLVYAVCSDESIQVLLVCGYTFCLLNGIPYVQAVCLPLYTPSDHLFEEGSKDFICRSFYVRSPKWRLVSLYRLHFNKIHVVSDENHSPHLVIRELFCSQCTSMKFAWEFLPREMQVGVLDPDELVERSKAIHNGEYSTRELERRWKGNNTMAFPDMDIRNLIQEILNYWKEKPICGVAERPNHYDLRR